MPSCFALYDKTTGEQMVLQEVDRDMCIYFGVPVSETDWYKNWYNTVGLSLAIGHDWEKIRGFFPEKVDVIDYLERYFTTDSWKEWK